MSTCSFKITPPFCCTIEKLVDSILLSRCHYIIIIIVPGSCSHLIGINPIKPYKTKLSHTKPPFLVPQHITVPRRFIISSGKRPFSGAGFTPSSCSMSSTKMSQVFGWNDVREKGHEAIARGGKRWKNTAGRLVEFGVNLIFNLFGENEAVTQKKHGET